jgi:hypothetical protein
MNINGFSQFENLFPLQGGGSAFGKTDFSALFTLAMAKAQAAKAMDASSSAASATASYALSLEEYKDEFHQKIDAMPMHPSQYGVQQAISIADGLFEKMQADPELEKEILAQIQANLSQNLAEPPAYVIIRFDENGQFSRMNGTADTMDDYEKEAADAFWRSNSSDAESKASKRAEKKQQERKAEERKRMEELLTDLALQRRENARIAEELARGDAVSGYVRGPAPVMRPSVMDSI